VELARFNYVSAGYLETVGMTILEGRSIGEQDTETAPLAAVINQSMARKYFPQGSPLGRVMEIADPGRRGKPIQIVGVVRDARYNNLRAGTKPMFYMSIQQSPRTLRGIEVRTTESVTGISEQVRHAVLDVTPDLMIRRVATLDAQIDETIRPERMLANLCVAFGVIALLLASVGLYGVLAYSVAQRTGEIGIRMALGATRSAVLRLVLGQSAAVVVLGLVIGIALALATTRLLSTFLFGITPWDAGTMAAATAVLVLVAGVAAWLPARRATKVDPMVALRHE
jgi:predicted permease